MDLLVCPVIMVLQALLAPLVPEVQLVLMVPMERMAGLALMVPLDLLATAVQLVTSALLAPLDPLVFLAHQVLQVTAMNLVVMRSTELTRQPSEPRTMKLMPL